MCPSCLAVKKVEWTRELVIAEPDASNHLVVLGDEQRQWREEVEDDDEHRPPRSATQLRSNTAHNIGTKIEKAQLTHTREARSREQAV